MLYIETQGTWRDMGRQIGDAFADQLHNIVAHYRKLLNWPDDLTAAVTPIRDLLKTHCSPLWEESQGMAEGSGIDLMQLMAYRFVSEVHSALHPACTNVYFSDSDVGPLLGRNNDIEDDITQTIQLCRVSRPERGVATITTTYLGMAGGVGMNEHGVGLGGSSAHTTVSYDSGGVPAAVLMLDLLQQCRNVEDASRLFSERMFTGKSMNLLVGDGTGDSRLFECVPGLPPQPYDPPLRPWKACTNTFLSGRFPPPDENRYQESSFARYGLVAHRCEEGQTPFTLEGMKQLMTDAAMPGAVSDAMAGAWKTAYSEIFSLAERKAWISFGHPAEHPYREMVL